MARFADQPIGKHGASVNGEDGVPSVYAEMGVPSLQDQAACGGWLPHAQPLQGPPPDLRTMGTRGGSTPASDYDKKK